MSTQLLAGDRALVTGGGTGIGLGISQLLAELGAHVVMAARSSERAAKAREQILAEAPGASLEVAVLDLASLDSVRAAGDAIAAAHPVVDILVNGAGVMADSSQLGPGGVGGTPSPGGLPANGTLWLDADNDNVLDIFSQYDLIVDGTDNFATRYMVNDAAYFLNKPYVWGSIYRFDGQASVFWSEHGPCYRCLYPEPPPPGAVPSCAEGGVLGILPGTIAMVQATEQVYTFVMERGT